MERSGRIDGVGEFIITIELNRNIIRNINIAGDFFLLGDLDSITSRLKGRKFAEDDIEEALSDLNLSQVIMNLTPQQFIGLLFEKK